MSIAIAFNKFRWPATTTIDWFDTSTPSTTSSLLASKSQHPCPRPPPFVAATSRIVPQSLVESGFIGSDTLLWAFLIALSAQKLSLSLCCAWCPHGCVHCLKADQGRRLGISPFFKGPSSGTSAISVTVSVLRFAFEVQVFGGSIGQPGFCTWRGKNRWFGFRERKIALCRKDQSLALEKSATDSVYLNP